MLWHETLSYIRVEIVAGIYLANDTKIKLSKFLKESIGNIWAQDEG
jgi:hypothetical protein